MTESIEWSNPIFSEKNNLSMHSNHIYPIAEADISTVFKLCANTFVYSGIDDVFSTVTPVVVQDLVYFYFFNMFIDFSSLFSCINKIS